MKLSSTENAEEVFRNMDFDDVIDGSGALVSPAEMDIDGIEEVEPDDD